VSNFDAWALPGTIIGSVEGRALVPGTAVRRLLLTPDHVTEIAQGLRLAAPKLRGRSAASIAETLGGIGSRFRDPADMLRREALSALPETSGLSPQMSEYVLDGMCRDWSTEVFLELLEREFGDAGALDDPEFMADPSRLTTHVGAGSVPGVTATSLIRSLLVKSPTLVKPALGDVVLPVLWARAIHASDSTLGDALAVAYWPGADRSVATAAFAGADQVVVYGSDATVAEVRGTLREDQRLVAYPHRVGLCGLGRESLAPGDLRARARDAALAVATFDQRGCVSPHVVYVEEGGGSTAADFAQLLAEELSKLEGELPSGVRSPQEAIAFQQLKGTLEMRVAAGDQVVVLASPGEPWAVILDAEPGFRSSCLGRFIWVKQIGDLAELAGLLAPVARNLQTVALEVDHVRLEQLGTALRRIGASRITTLSEAPWPRAWWRHDGRGPLRVLLGRDD
jgi:Acyl-CoA reductase (LuxC)